MQLNVSLFVTPIIFLILGPECLSNQAQLNMRKIWLVSTDHLEDELWFRDLEDFRVGMNFVAVEAAAQPNVNILTFILMSNHVHFLMKAELQDVENFMQQYKHRYSIYVRKKWGIKKFLRRNGLDIREIPYYDESVERAFAYVQMNCVVANICSHPCQYPWGTGDTFFSPERPMTEKRIRDLSYRERERLLHTNCSSLPKDWRISVEGYILPKEYVDVQDVERILRDASRMNYFFRTSSKARKKLEADKNLPAFRDQIILSALPDLCRSLFHKESFSELLVKEKAEFMRQIRFRFSSDVSQIARVCGVSYADAAKLMDSSD